MKPSLFENELLAVADPLFTVIFQGLWCAADREGRLEDRPAKIHITVNPGRAFEGTARSLDWLTENEFIVRYEVAGKKYIYIPAFTKHQRPHQNEAASVIPPPTSDQGAKRGTPRDEVASHHGQQRFALNPSSLNPESPIPSLRSGRAREKPEFDPASVPDLNLKAWSRWIEYRVEAKMKLKPVSLPSAARKLAAFGADQEAVVEQSIAAGWQGLFALKDDNNGRRNTQRLTRYDATQANLDRIIAAGEVLEGDDRIVRTEVGGELRRGAVPALGSSDREPD